MGQPNRPDNHRTSRTVDRIDAQAASSRKRSFRRDRHRRALSSAIARPCRASVPPIAPDMLARDHVRRARCAPEQPPSAAIEIIALRLASPKRGEHGQANAEQQQDAAHLPLFVHANEPKFI
jgi:hypothetical protein